MWKALKGVSLSNKSHLQSSKRERKGEDFLIEVDKEIIFPFSRLKDRTKLVDEAIYTYLWVQNDWHPVFGQWTGG